MAIDNEYYDYHIKASETGDVLAHACDTILGTVHGLTLGDLCEAVERHEDDCEGDDE